MEQRLIDAIHQAKYVHIEEDLGLILVWKGGTYVNTYDYEGNPLDCMSRHFVNKNTPDVYDVQEMIADYLERILDDEREDDSWDESPDLDECQECDVRDLEECQECDAYIAAEEEKQKLLDDLCKYL